MDQAAALKKFAFVGGFLGYIAYEVALFFVAKVVNSAQKA